ncbi:MAG: hypothetical protein ACPGSD_07780 [Flavobacteriales bacterium]
MARKKSDKELLQDWQGYKENHLKGSPIDLKETASQKRKRIQKLESNYEEWFKYYFSKFYKSEPAPFHVRASKRIIQNDEWYEVRSWSRELAKSTRTMMEVMYLTLTGKKKNVLLVSASYDNAEDLLKPYKTLLEVNQRIINDYGIQHKPGAWESGKFTTKLGISFRALGKGQSPRGTKNDEVRPDLILIDDIDTDEECRNADRIKESVKWIEEALIPTKSISEPLLILVCGNIIARYCCITEMGKKADKHEIINVRDKAGKSTWPQKNSEEAIDRTLKLISYNAAQKEYFNNPVSEGDTFKEMTFGKVPKLSTCDQVLIYADPATSDKDVSAASDKAVAIVAKKGLKYYVYKIWLDTMKNSKFIDCLFQAYKVVKHEKVDVCKVWIENNSLQAPFYTQVLWPLIKKTARALKTQIPITPDTRIKKNKFIRIDGTLEPKSRNGELILNADEELDPHMQRLVSQFLGVSPRAKKMDGPDCIEGGVWLLEKSSQIFDYDYVGPSTNSRRY